jgi:hypothetical protein
MRPDPLDPERPCCGADARSLGVRPGTDVPATTAHDVAQPGAGGMSVTPGDPRHLPPHRRSPVFGGVGKDPVFALDTADLGDDLRYRPDPRRPKVHGFVEPTAPMALQAYQTALCNTGRRWRRAR